MNAQGMHRGGVEEQERAAAILEANRDYRILRRLRLRDASLPPEGVTTKRAVIVDVETTGVDQCVDEIIELAMLKFDYSIDGGFVPTADTVVEAGDQVLLVLDSGLEDQITPVFAPD